MLTREYGVELRYTAATDYLRFCGQYWVESKQQAVGAAEEFLDLQLADAKDEIARTKQALMDTGISEDAIASGGKSLEKKISGGQMDAYLAYMSALGYKAFVMKRRDMKYVVSALLGIEPIPNIADKIAAMIEKYRAETIDIEDVEFEEVDLELDSLFPDPRQQDTDSDNGREENIL